MSAADKFWSKVDIGEPNQCWLWKGARTKGGYGSLHVTRATTTTAHRMAWILTNGPVDESIEVCHNCPTGDNKLCVNPSHLFLGTPLENTRDYIQKGNRRTYSGGAEFGEDNSQSVLTEQDVREIRKLRKDGNTYTSIAKIFGVNIQTVCNVCSGKSWSHVKDS